MQSYNYYATHIYATIYSYNFQRNFSPQHINKTSVTVMAVVLFGNDTSPDRVVPNTNKDAHVVVVVPPLHVPMIADPRIP